MKNVKKTVDLDKMTPAQSRVAIAKDVIESLLAERFKATTGTYIYSRSATANGIAVQGTVNLKDAIQKNMKSCKVCAKGAMFVAAVERFNQIYSEVRRPGDNVLEEFSHDVEICDHLGKYFTKRQLDLIEMAFEGEGEDMFIDELVEEKKYVALAYSFIHKNPEDRMIAIMQNIIANKGEFVCSYKNLKLV